MDRQPQEQRNPPPVRILVAEDNPDGRQALSRLLELLGYEVVLADDGEQGVSRGLASCPDVALIDIGLPRIDGYEVARQLRSGLGPQVFLIAHTAYGRPEDRAEALAAGFDVHLVKPLVFGDLVACLHEASQDRGGKQPMSEASPSRWSRGEDRSDLRN